MDAVLCGIVGILLGYGLSLFARKYKKSSQEIDEYLKAAAGLSNSPDEILNWPLLVVPD